MRPWEASSSTARAQAAIVATVPASSRSMRHNIFPPFILAAAVDAAVAAVIRSSSSNDAPARPPAVERREHDLVFERAEQHQVVENVGGGQHAVHTRVGQRRTQPVEQVGAAVHRGGASPDAEGAACGMVGGDDHQPAVAPDGGPCRARSARRASMAAGIGRAQIGDRGVVRGTVPQTLTASTAVCSASAATSSAVGIAVEHSSRDATMAPAALA